MSTKKIPETVIVMCDACFRECSKSNRIQEGTVTVKQHAIDWHNNPAADGTVSFDFCDLCLNRVVAVINHEVRRIRDAKPIEGKDSES